MIPYRRSSELMTMIMELTDYGIEYSEVELNVTWMLIRGNKNSLHENTRVVAMQRSTGTTTTALALDAYPWSDLMS